MFFSKLGRINDSRLAARLIASILPAANLIAPETGWSAEVRAGALPDAYMLWMSTNRPVELRDLVTGGRQLFFFVLRGEGHIDGPNGLYLMDVRHAVSLESTDGIAVRAEAGCEGLWLAVRRSALLRRLAALLGRAVPRPLTFAARFDAADEGPSAVVDFATGLIGPSVGQVLTRMPESASALSEVLLDFLLFALPHNYSLELRRPASKVAPRHVKRAIDFIEENARAPVNIETLAEICQVSPRALQYGFKSFLGVAPMEYIRAVRLRLAREAILRDGRPLTAIAQDWGFSNFSRFSAQFQMAFGESPSTLRRRRPT